MLQLLVEVPLRGAGGVRTRKSLRHEIICQLRDPDAKLLRRRADRRSEISLMELVPAFSCGGDESDPKAASPVPEEVCET